MELLKQIPAHEDVMIGSYRNFPICVTFDPWNTAYGFSLVGQETYRGFFGDSPEGNIQRLDNALDKIEQDIADIERTLSDTREKLAIAKVEVTKPFEKADVLKEKVLRLAEVNRILDMGEVEELDNPNPLLEDVKAAIVSLYQREFNSEQLSEEQVLVNLFPDKDRAVLLDREAGDAHIQLVIHLTDLSFCQLVNGQEITRETFEANSIEESSQRLIDFLTLSSREDLLQLDQERLREKTGLALTDQGQFYDPLALDMDNDGIADRYDHDFRDSDAFESQYDVDEAEKRLSTLAQIASFQSQDREGEAMTIKTDRRTEHEL